VRLPATLPPEARVRRRADYLRVQKQSLRVAAPHFVFLLIASPPIAGATSTPRRPRLGIIASKQIGNAIVRARGKRLTRAAFRELWPRFPAGLDVVVLLRGDITKLKLVDVLAEWRAAESNIVRRGKAALAPLAPPPTPVAPAAPR
jgi:ribonuclease P protein component